MEMGNRWWWIVPLHTKNMGYWSTATPLHHLTCEKGRREEKTIDMEKKSDEYLHPENVGYLIWESTLPGRKVKQNEVKIYEWKIISVSKRVVVVTSIPRT